MVIDDRSLLVVLLVLDSSCGVGGGAEAHVDLVAVAAVARDDVLDRSAGRAGEAAEDEEGRVDRGLEAAGGRALGGLAPQGLLGGVDDEAVAVGEERVERAGEVLGVEVGEQRTGVPPLLDRHRLTVREPHAVDPPGGAARTEAQRLDDLGRGALLVDEHQARRGVEAAAAHVVGERRQVQPALDAGTGDEGALALDPVEQAARDQAVDRLAHGGARDVVRRHELALRRDGRVRTELAGRQVGQRVAELRVLGPGAVVDPAGHLHPLRPSTSARSIGTVWYVPVGSMAPESRACQGPP